MAGSGSDLTWQSSGAPTHGLIGDINTMRISPDYLGMAQDVIIDTAGILRTRGGIQAYSSDTFSNLLITGAAQIPTSPLTNAGTILTLRDASGSNFIYGTSNTALTGFAKLTASSQSIGAAAQSLYDTAQMSPSFTRLPNDQGFLICQGSTNIGTNGFTNWGLPTLWGGNAVTTSNTSTGTGASTAGSKTITGAGTAWTSALAGCYLFINQTYVGQVDTVSGVTSILLKKGALATVAAAAPTFKTARPPMYLIYKGRITTNTSSAVVVGSNTKFVSSGPGGSGGAFLTTTPAASIYRYSDGAFIGIVSTVQNDTTLTLTASAAIALVNEEYYMVNNCQTIAIGLNSIPSAAFSATCCEFYADRYWYGGIAASDVPLANSKSASPYYNLVSSTAFSSANTLAFTKKNDPECLDLDPVAGDTLKLPTGSSADTIRGLCAVKGGMVIFRLNDTFLLTGYSPDTFRIVKIVDDGSFFNSSFKPYKDGVIWNGKKSVWYFDGVRVVDLLDGKIKRWYRRNNFGSVTFQNGIAIAQDHVMLSLNVGGITWPYKNTTKSALYLVMVINMTNGAISFFTNLFVVNSMFQNDGTSILITADTTPNSKLVNGDKIFTDSTTGSDNFDALTGITTFSSGAQIGPDAMFETTKITFGDATRLKTFKRFLMNYSADVSMSSTIIGTNLTGLDFPNISTGTVSSDTFAVSSGTGILHRLRFLVRTPAVAIRVYQTSTTSATSQRFKCMWWSLGGKLMRQGRVQP